MSGADASGKGLFAFLPWLILIASLVGAWATWQYMRPRVRPDLPAPVLRWAQVMADEGVKTEPGLVRAISPVPGFIYNAIYTEKGSERVVFLQWFNKPEAAQAQAERLQRLPEEKAARSAGVFVLRLPGWPEGDGLTQRLQARFEVFAQEQGNPDPVASR